MDFSINSECTLFFGNYSLLKLSVKITGFRFFHLRVLPHQSLCVGREMGRKRNKGKARQAKRIALVGTQRADVPVNPVLSLSLPRPPTPPRSFWPQSFFEKKSKRKRPLRRCRHGAESCTMAALIFRSSLEVMVSRKLATRMALPHALFHSFRVASSTFVGDLDDPNFREMVNPSMWPPA